MEMLLVAALAAAGLIGGLYWRRRRGPAAGGGKTRRPADALDTLSAWAPQATRVLTHPEQLAMSVLVRALPDHIVLAQVPLARFIRVPQRHSYSEWLRRVGQLSPDLLVCDTTSQVLAAVETGKAGIKSTARANKRLERMRRVLTEAGIPLHTWMEGKLPTPEQARETLLPAAAVAPLAVAAAPNYSVPAATTPATAATARVLPPIDVDLALDEAQEQREPPPSTWFDEDFENRVNATARGESPAVASSR